MVVLIKDDSNADKSPFLVGRSFVLRWEGGNSTPFPLILLLHSNHIELSCEPVLVQYCGLSGWRRWWLVSKNSEGYRGSRISSVLVVLWRPLQRYWNSPGNSFYLRHFQLLLPLTTSSFALPLPP